MKFVYSLEKIVYHLNSASEVKKKKKRNLYSSNPIVTKDTMAEIPQTMKGVVIEKTGGTEVLDYKTDLTVPTPQEGQVLIKNSFAGVNFIDT
jgi:hypothetical protein